MARVGLKSVVSLKVELFSVLKKWAFFRPNFPGARGFCIIQVTY